MTTRRKFLKVVGAGASVLSVGAMPIACAGAPPAPEDVDGGNVADLDVGTVAQVPDSTVIVGRDAAGVYALTSICTHFGCDINDSGSVSGGTINCACHGSKFELDGSVSNGPANSPLQHWAVDVDDAGAITVHVGVEAAADERVAV